MDSSEEIRLLVPNGNNNGVLLWMRVHLTSLRAHGKPFPTPTKLAEDAAHAFHRHKWLSDPEHWIWNAAYIALYEVSNE